MLNDLDAPSLIQFHDDMLSDPDWPGSQFLAARSGVWLWIAANHQYNTLLWNEEDKARRTATFRARGWPSNAPSCFRASSHRTAVPRR